MKLGIDILEKEIVARKQEAVLISTRIEKKQNIETNEKNLEYIQVEINELEEAVRRLKNGNK